MMTTLVIALMLSFATNAEAMTIPGQWVWTAKVLDFQVGSLADQLWDRGDTVQIKALVQDSPYATSFNDGPDNIFEFGFGDDTIDSPWNGPVTDRTYNAIYEMDSKLDTFIKSLQTEWEVENFNHSTALWLNRTIGNSLIYHAEGIYLTWWDLNDSASWGRLLTYDTPLGCSLVTFNNIHRNPVPEPTSMLLFSTGLLGLAGFNYRRKKKA